MLHISNDYSSLTNHKDNTIGLRHDEGLVQDWDHGLLNRSLPGPLLEVPDEARDVIDDVVNLAGVGLGGGLAKVSKK